MKPRAGNGTSPKSDPAEGRGNLPAMPSEWATVDTLMRDLGAVVSAATEVRASVPASAADEAIREAAEAVNRTISAPGNVRLLAAARKAIQTAHDVIARLHSDTARSR